MMITMMIEPMTLPIVHPLGNEYFLGSLQLMVLRVLLLSREEQKLPRRRTEISMTYMKESDTHPRRGRMLLITMQSLKHTRHNGTYTADGYCAIQLMVNSSGR